MPTAPGERVTLYIDPSAASFIACVRKRHRFKVRPADNSVIDGIRNVQTALTRGVIKINDVCRNTIEEFGLYRWDDKAVEDAVIKDNDHSMDAVRYFVQTANLIRKADRDKRYADVSRLY